MSKREERAKSTANTTQQDSITALAAVSGQLPPQVPDYEASVLGAILMDKDALQNVVEILKPEHFYVEANQLVYTAMLNLNAQMAPIDMLTVCSELKRTNDFTKVGGEFYIAQLTTRMGSALNIEYHARMIFQKYLQRSLIHLGTDLMTMGFDETRDVEDLLEDAENSLFQLSQGSLKRDVVQIEPIIKEAITQMKEAAKREDQLSGIPCGFPSIDKVTLGWQPATMVVIAARPAMGKTAFVLSMARKMACDHGIPVAMFSLEMSNVELVKRLMVAETEIESEKIKNGRLSTDEWATFDQRMTRLMKAPIYIDDTPGLSIFDIRSKSRILKKKHDIKCIIIDYLQLMTASALKPGNRQEEVSMISRSLKGLSKELNIPVIALSQLNRNVEQRGSGVNGATVDGKRPQLSDLRESGAIEQDADMVCFLHRPEYYKITDDGQGHSLIGKAFFIIAKHRSGRTADILLDFQADLIRFEEEGSNQHFIMSGINGGAPSLGGGTPTPQPVGGLPDLSKQGEETPF